MEHDLASYVLRRIPELGLGYHITYTPNFGSFYKMTSPCVCKGSGRNLANVESRAASAKI